MSKRNSMSNYSKRPAARSDGAVIAWRAVYDRLSFLIMLAVAASLLLMGRSEGAFVRETRSLVMAVATPILDVASRPLESVENALDNVQGMLSVYEENQRLKAELEQLQGWEIVARRLDAENKAMQRLLTVSPESVPVIVTARVIADTSTPFVRTLIIDQGSNMGIERGQAVTSGRGLIGRIDGVSANSARILLVTDLNSRIPVKLDDDGARGVVMGTNGATLSLSFLTSNAVPEPGQILVTSGDGGLFPADVPVGEVARVRENDPVAVRPLADLDRLDFVRVLKLKADLNLPEQADHRPLPRLEGGLIDPAGSARPASDTDVVSGDFVEPRPMTAVRPHPRPPVPVRDDEAASPAQ